MSRFRRGPKIRPVDEDMEVVTAWIDQTIDGPSSDKDLDKHPNHVQSRDTDERIMQLEIEAPRGLFSRRQPPPAIVDATIVDVEAGEGYRDEEGEHHRPSKLGLHVKQLPNAELDDQGQPLPPTTDANADGLTHPSWLKGFFRGAHLTASVDHGNNTAELIDNDKFHRRHWS